MAAGLGFKTFNTGDILSASDTNGYLMQGVLVFASAAARDAAITSPQEGQFAYLKDTNVTTYYTGSAWANLDTTGMTNPMTTTGDTIYSSSGSTPARLGIGTTGQVLTVAGGVPSWAAPAGGGKVLQVIQDTVTNSVSTTSSSFVDTGLDVTITPATTGSRILVMATLGNVAKFPGSGNSSIALEIDRGGTQVYYGTDGSHFDNTSSYLYIGPISFSKVDSPNTTSAITYKVRFANYVSGQTSTINHSTGGSATTIQSTLIAIEIGA